MLSTTIVHVCPRYGCVKTATPTTRQVVAYTLGDRSQAGAQSLRAHVPENYRRRGTLSDFRLAHGEAFPKRTHRFCGKEEGETNHAQRWFGTVRARHNRRVRRTYPFSKSVERQLEAIHLFIANDNLQIQAKQQRG